MQLLLDAESVSQVVDVNQYGIIDYTNMRINKKLSFEVFLYLKHLFEQIVDLKKMCLTF